MRLHLLANNWLFKAPGALGRIAMRLWLAVGWRLALLLLAQLWLIPPAARALTPSQVYEQVKDSVVVIKVYNQRGRLVQLGSGVMLPSGDIITNHHVIRSGGRYVVAWDKKTKPAVVKASAPHKDLCLLAAPGLTAKPARLGRAARLKVGEPVYAVGAPQGLELSLSEGIVSQLRGGPPPLIQTTVAISPGSSGGGLFNAEGELVGITTCYLKGGQSLNFALPVEWAGAEAREKNPGRPMAERPVPPAPGPRSKPTWSDRATALEKTQDWQGLLSHGRAWTKAEPDNEAAWVSLGLAYGQMGHYQDSIEANREAVRLKPDSATAWNNLGFTLAKIGRSHDSIRAYREALRIKPDLTTAWYNLGLAYAQAGNRTAALEAVKELRRYDPQQADKLLDQIKKP